MSSEVLVVGLPAALRSRLESRARQDGKRIRSLLIDVGNTRTPYFLPHPSTAIHTLREFTADSADALKVVVLPYAELPEDVASEIAAVVELGLGEVVVVEAGKKDWPLYNKNERLNNHFLAATWLALETLIFGSAQVSPADVVLRAMSACPAIKVADGALDTCNKIANHRISFVQEVLKAFATLCEKRGAVGPIADFFDSQGIYYAHTGGMTVSFEAFRGDESVYKRESNIHLKKGDATTPQAAVRCYFEIVESETDYFVVITYLGIHRYADMSARISL